MRKKSLKFNYDKDEDILFLYTEDDYKSSVEMFGFIVDFNRKNEIKGIEIHNATRVLSELTEKKITKKLLGSLIESFLNVKKSNKMIIAEFDMRTEKDSFVLPLTMNNPSYNFARI